MVKATLARVLAPRRRPTIHGVGGAAVESRPPVAALDDWARMRRFLVLGADGPTYVAGAQPPGRADVDLVLRCLAVDGRRVVDKLVRYGDGGHLPERDAVIFALAAACATEDDDVRAYALSMLPRVCRTGDQLLRFVRAVEEHRGWGRALRRAVAAWYTDRPSDALAYQLVRYPARGGWTHRDVLRLAKPQPVRGGSTDLALRWAVRGPAMLPPGTPTLIRAHAAIDRSRSPAAAAALILKHRVPWEALSPAQLREPELWRALLPHLRLDVLLPNLVRLTSVRALTPRSQATDLVVRRLSDLDELRRSHLHPIQFLSALVTYGRGRDQPGHPYTEPILEVVEALDRAFYATLPTVAPAGSRTLIATDVSGSMGVGEIIGMPGLTPQLASAAMTAVTLATEPATEVLAFSATGRHAWRPSAGSAEARTGLVPLPVARGQRIEEIVRRMDGMRFTETDCALPMLYALDHGRAVDTFVVYTDSDPWNGDVRPVDALRRYRDRTGIAARLIVVGLRARRFEIADPDDAGMLDVVGFDAATPRLMTDFSAGRLGW